MLTKKEIQVLKLRQDGLTQVAVAKELQISQAAVSQFEQNARQKIRDAQETLKIAELLNVAPDDPIEELLREASSKQSTKQSTRGGRK